MMYSIIPEANWPIKCYCDIERYLVLAIKNLSLTQGYPVQPCSIAAKRTRARDPAARKADSAKLPARYGIANGPQGRIPAFSSCSLTAAPR